MLNSLSLGYISNATAICQVSFSRFTMILKSSFLNIHVFVGYLLSTILQMLLQAVAYMLLSSIPLT